jgi:hypothetical protein
MTAARRRTEGRRLQPRALAQKVIFYAKLGRKFRDHFPARQGLKTGARAFSKSVVSRVTTVNP